jgi:hypothetical protein
MKYIDSLKMCELAIVQVEVVRTTRSMVCLRDVMTVADRSISTADGV